MAKKYRDYVLHDLPIMWTEKNLVILLFLLRGFFQNCILLFQSFGMTKMINVLVNRVILFGLVFLLLLLLVQDIIFGLVCYAESIDDEEEEYAPVTVTETAQEKGDSSSGSSET